MPPRRRRPTFSPGPGATPRPSPTGRRRPSRSWAGCSTSRAERDGQLQAAQEAEGRLSAEVQAAADRVTAADLAVAERMRLLLDAYRSYLSGLAELRVADPDELIAALESWGLTGEGANPAAAIIDDAARAAGAELGRLAGELNTSADPACRRGRASWRRRSAGCARAATTPRRSRTRGPPGVPRRPSRRAAVEGDRLRAGPVRRRARRAGGGPGGGGDSRRVGNARGEPRRRGRDRGFRACPGGRGIVRQPASARDRSRRPPGWSVAGRVGGIRSECYRTWARDRRHRRGPG